MQVSPARLKEPEAQHPGENGHRTTASISYANGRGLSATAAYSEKNRDPGATLSAWLAKVNWDRDDHHTLFGRVENVKNDELFSDHDDPLHDGPFRVIEFQGGLCLSPANHRAAESGARGQYRGVRQAARAQCRLWQEPERRDGLRPIEHRSLM